MQPLDPLRLPLQGLHLIEASAGTGKTQTISSLYLRLLLEKPLSIEHILVVTFTQAASEELRERIRQRLKAAYHANLSGHTEDPFLLALQQRCSPETAQTRLYDAIKRMDEMAVFTLHGFCQRVLQAYAFECGVLFHADFITDEQPLIQEVVEDYWRIHFYTADRPLSEFIQKHIQTPTLLQKHITPRLNQAEIRTVPHFEQLNLGQYTQDITQAQQHLHRLLQTQIDTIKVLLSSDALLRPLYHPNQTHAWLQHLGDYLQDPEQRFCLPDYFKRLTPAGLKLGCRENYQAPEHAFFQQCADYQRLVSRLSGFIHYDCLRYTQAELSRRKQAQGQHSFHDLLTQLDQALIANPTLAHTLRSQYPMAMMDEFQDTDPVQYRIFKTLYPATADNTGLFMIGDPKQAIYSFRGADVFTYIRARRDTAAHARYTLETNWRSSAEMVTAINTLFTQSPRPFIYHTDIPFHPAKAADNSRTPALWVKQQAMQALSFVLLPRVDKNHFGKAYRNNRRGTTRFQAIRKQWAGDASCTYVANDIARLLNHSKQGQATLKGKPIEPKHFAILVQNRFQARNIQAALRDKNIATVFYSRDSVLNTQDAADVLLLLTAVAFYSQETHIRSALCTRLVGMSAYALDQLSQDECQWQLCLNKFETFYTVWTEHSFLSMFRQMLHQLDIPKQLLGSTHGERHLTNVLQLGEVLESACAENPTPEQLIQWLHEQSQQYNAEDESQQLRLESDADLVKIITIHKSKGLEFDIVYLPYLWDSKALTPEAGFSFHSAEQHELTVDLGSDQRNQHYQQAEQERLAEHLRLLYVAVTRAKYHCCITWGQVSEAPFSALAYLLHHRPSSLDALVNTTAVAYQVAQLSDPDLIAQLQIYAAHSQGCISVTTLPSNPSQACYDAPLTPVTLKARQPDPVMRRPWQVTSYTALTASHAYLPLERPDDDQQQTSTPSMFTFPTGTKTGILMHRILQAIHFIDDTPAEHEILSRDLLQQYGFEEAWLPVICTMIQQVLHTPLNAQGLSLKHIHPQQCLRELAFYCPLQNFNACQLNQLLKQALGESYQALNFDTMNGMIKGFIDLVFEFEGRYYIVDYKSNHLGHHLSDYDGPALQAVMTSQHYDVQYLIYSLALHRYLRQRLPQYDYAQHFGGVYYLFLRGMRISQPVHSGIYAVYPKKSLIQRLDALLAGHSPALESITPPESITPEHELPASRDINLKEGD